jgi:hypothetical protein
VADPPAPVWRRAVEGLDLLRVDDPVDEDRSTAMPYAV